MVFRIIQGGEVGPVVFNFGTVGHLKANRTKYGLNALPGLDNRMDATKPAPTSWQGYIDGLLSQFLIQGGLCKCIPALRQQAFDLALDIVNVGALFTARGGFKTGQAFKQRSNRP